MVLKKKKSQNKSKNVNQLSGFEQNPTASQNTHKVFILGIYMVSQYGEPKLITDSFVWSRLITSMHFCSTKLDF